jgi:NAD(P)H-dependent FMN reductase
MRKIYKGINYNKTIIKVLILQGSTRANGNTAWMAEEYKKAAVGQWKSHLLIVNHHLHQFAQAVNLLCRAAPCLHLEHAYADAR